jgi:hypothetical protein
MSMRVMVLVAFYVVVSAGCGAATKAPIEAPDYGPESGPAPADGKDDSATRPASMAALTPMVPMRTTFTSTSHWRAFKFSGSAGDSVDVYVDGLNGLDTVLYIYRISRVTGRPYYRPIAVNDDTSEQGWTVGSNRTFNPYSSSVSHVVLPEDRDYAVVVTTYDKAVGSALVLLKSSTPAGGKLSFLGDGSGTAVSVGGLSARRLPLSAEASALVGFTPSNMTTNAAAFRFSAASLQSALADPSSRHDLIAAVFKSGFDQTGGVPYIEEAQTVVQAVSGSPGHILFENLIGQMGVDGTTDQWPTVEQNYNTLGAAMTAGGVTDLFTAHFDNNDDMNYDAVVAVNSATGDVRMLAFRNDP